MSRAVLGSLIVGKVMMKHSSRQLAANFQDLVAKVKNLVALAPVLGAISRPDYAIFC